MPLSLCVKRGVEDCAVGTGRGTRTSTEMATSESRAGQCEVGGWWSPWGQSSMQSSKASSRSHAGVSLVPGVPAGIGPHFLLPAASGSTLTISEVWEEIAAGPIGWGPPACGLLGSPGPLGQTVIPHLPGESLWSWAWVTLSPHSPVIFPSLSQALTAVLATEAVFCL